MKLSTRSTSVANITTEAPSKISLGFVPALSFNRKSLSSNLDDFPLLISSALLELEVRMKGVLFFSNTADPSAHPHAPPPIITVLFINLFLYFNLNKTIRKVVIINHVMINTLFPEITNPFF